MSDVSRRSFLSGAATAGLALAAAGAASAAPSTGSLGSAAPVATTREDHRVIVIGSGFGGGVASLRLAQAGVPVTVLERGLRWPTGPNANTFPNPAAPDKRMLWYQSAPDIFGRPVRVDPYAGILEAVHGDNMTALCGTGVGGGSLIYQGMTLQPTEAMFYSQFPGAMNYGELNDVFYPRALGMIRPSPAPDALIDSPTYEAARVFARNARAAGLPASKIPMPIDWNFALDELAGKMRPSYTNGDCLLGVNNGGKHSVNVTYLAAAEATGRVSVETLHRVTDVERAPDGRWTVYVARTDSAGNTIENKILTAGAVILAAGSANTSKLLVRASATGSIPDLPGGVGFGWGTNADRISMWTDFVDDFGAVQGGPVTYGSLNWGDPGAAATIAQVPLPPLAFDSRTTMLFGCGKSDARGNFFYNSLTDTVDLHWPANGDWPIQSGTIDPLMNRIAGSQGRVTDVSAVAPTTVHPLGGACMGSVCDLEGRVHGQRGLYVVDGALMPGGTSAANPSLTIAAVAERALDRIVRSDVGAVI